MNAFVRVTAKTAEDILQRDKFSKEAEALLINGISPDHYVDVLAQNRLFNDCIRFLSHALPKREAVWWACLCGRRVIGAYTSPKVVTALEAAERWVRNPTEDNRRTTMPAAEEAELGNPGGCAAIAAFWSGGSLAPLNAPVVPPADHLTGHGVTCAVLLAAVHREPQTADEKYREFVALGGDVARGKQLWE